MALRQETGIAEDWQERSKIMDAVYKEEKIVPYCRVNIVRNAANGQEVLHTYDLPRRMVWDRMWVIEWRRARFVCKYPKDNVRLLFSFYDRTSGLELEYDSLLSKMTSAKALVTKYRNTRSQYIGEREKELFFDAGSDENLKKIDAKIERAGQKLQLIKREIEIWKNRDKA